MTPPSYGRLIALVVGLTLGVASSPALAHFPTSGDADNDPGRCLLRNNSGRCIIRKPSITKYKNIVHLDAGATLAGRIALEYERSLHRRVSLFSGVYGVLFNSLLNQDLIGLGMFVGARAFLFGAAPEGLWASGELGVIHRRVRHQSNIHMTAFETAALLGYTGVFKRFSVSLGGGLLLMRGRVTVRDDGSVPGREWGPRVRFSVGLAF